ncbi:7-carboxy-7-deazaguanine synthase QueE [Prevotella sp. OH937_COT-195]|uniref:7-carboxy-7-deazaguanine synthase QueE n=1 Tax=Prevotella sp. OH937_COT-195 TaxID=2491051 RepID=UPI000F649ED6|nr:radical SAM protein [Prevotella sp. OH937_COT-195]RRD02637.1 radical SAM protein [Prevotella sp. OH937_COT-195]
MYRINDIFSSLQGEGHNTGRAATFVRFAGCNLRCSFCDTDFSEYSEMTAGEIVDAVAKHPARFVVLTGGEPSLQTDDTLVNALHEAGFTIAMETNGTRRCPEGIDWVTVSPKKMLHETGNLDDMEKYEDALRRANEIKIVFDGEHDPEDFLPSSFNTPTPLLYLQPCDTGDTNRNKEILSKCIAYIMSHPKWRLSLQTHKLANFK